MTSSAVTSLQYGAILTGLAGGLALFLYGMRKMIEALGTVAGGGMKHVLGRLTTNRFSGGVAGALVTAVIQSSSVTTVLVVGFISAGLMSFPQSLGVIIGANIGTTITAQIIAFQVTRYALVLIGVGFLLEFATKNRKVRHSGIVLMGLGLIFFGMELMSEATSPLRTYEPFIDLMRQLEHPLPGVLLGMAFTALVQSSSATTGIVIVLAGQGFITLEAGIALVLGANVGTCVTAGLSAIGRPREALQAATAHIIFNLLGVLLWAAFIPQLADLVRAVSPASAGIEGAARLAVDTPRQVANAHTLFNVGNAILFIWFTGPLARLVEAIVPKRAEAESTRVKPLFLDEFYLEQPAMALDQVRRELGRLGERALVMTRRAFEAVTVGTGEELDRLREMDAEVDELHGHVITYLGRLSLRDLVEGQPREIYRYIAAANAIENIGDVVETTLIEDGRRRLEKGLTISDETREVLAPLHEKVCWSVETALGALANKDRVLAESVAHSKKDFNELAEQARAHLARRLVAHEPDRLEVFRIESDVIESLKRMHTLSRRIANAVIEIEKRASRPVPAG